jgi:hypothetical protein
MADEPPSDSRADVLDLVDRLRRLAYMLDEREWDEHEWVTEAADLIEAEL